VYTSFRAVNYDTSVHKPEHSLSPAAETGGLSAQVWPGPTRHYRWRASDECWSPQASAFIDRCISSC